MFAMPTRVERALAFMLLGSAIYHFIDLARTVWPFTTDDAYITLRYAHHWADGAGVMWNVDGIPVEGYSNFGFVALAAAAIEAGLDPVAFLKGLGIGAAIVTACLLYRLARHQVSPLVATIPGVIFLAFPGVVWWAVSGLETTVYSAFVVASVALFGRGLENHRSTGTGISSPRMLLAGALVALSGMVRPEGPIVGVAFVLVVLVRTVPVLTKRWWREVWVELRPLVPLGLGFLPLYVPYTAWRIQTFGHFMPNSAACKANAQGSPWALIIDYVPVLILATLVIVWAWRRMADPRNLVCLTINALYVVLLYGVDTTIGYGLRHFFVAFAVLMIPVAVGVEALVSRRRSSGGLRRLVVATAVHTIVLGLVVLCNVEDRLGVFAEGYAERGRVREDVAKWLDETLPDDGHYVMGDVGLAGYQTPHLKVVDAYCINNEAMGRAPEGQAYEALANIIRRDLPDAIIVSSKSAVELRSRSKKFDRLLADPSIGPHYSLARIFGDGRDGFNYWVYLRTADP